jgi:hypothetical protein
MPQYNSFWQDLLREFNSKLDQDQPLQQTFHESEIEKVGNRKSYSGYLEVFGCDVRNYTDSPVFRDLEEVVKKNGHIKTKLTGLLRVQVDQNNVVSFNYQPFSYELMMVRYRHYQSRTQMADELYKWKLVKDFQLQWQEYKNGELPFQDFMQKVNWENLVYHMFVPNFNHLINKKPDSVEEALQELYNLEKPLQERVDAFRDQLHQLHEQEKEKSSDQLFLSEREIATLLTFRYPERYTFFIPSFYSPLAKGLGRKIPVKWQRLVDYYEIVDQFKSQVLPKYEDTIAEKNRLTQGEDYYSDDEHLLLIQDIFFVTLMAGKNFIPEDHTYNTTNMDYFNEEDFDLLSQYAGTTKEENNKEHQSAYNRLRSTYDKVGNWGELIKDNFFNEGRVKIVRKPTNQGNVFEHYQWVKVYPDSEAPKKLAYTLVLEKDGLAIKIDTVGLDDHSAMRKKYLEYRGQDDSSPIVKQLPKDEALKMGWNELMDYTTEIITVMQPHYQELCQRLGFVDATSSNLRSEEPARNQIFFGPPGTGKTYKLKNELFQKYIDRETSISAEKHFEQTTKDLSWWQAVALALLEIGDAKVGEIMHNRWVQQKANVSESKSLSATLWNTLQYHTIEESETVGIKGRALPLIFDKMSEARWKILKEEVDQQTPELLEIKQSIDIFKPDPDKLIKRYVFTTFHQSFAYEDFIEGIKPVLDSEVGTDITYEIEAGIFKRLCEDAASDPDNRYAIFIDEINRGNIANIFGELITLIEPDKRKGCANEISVELPYSKKEFSVPANVDIYGTMNTADRSVEALDTALRRRFTFEEMMPDPSLIEKELGGKNEWNGFKISDVLRTINKRIEVLVDSDHLIGHAYFLTLSQSANFEKELRSIFTDKIIPLLQEYFYNNYVKIGMVLGSGFISVQRSQDEDFAEIEDSLAADYSDRKLYRIIPAKEVNLKEAIAELMKTKRHDTIQQ